jgi:3-deoxy-D-arabino-heptulosonate 7-phosphate (DAHP) synthase class II
VRAYNQSAATLNLLRGFSTGGYAGALLLLLMMMTMMTM